MFIGLDKRGIAKLFKQVTIPTVGLFLILSCNQETPPTIQDATTINDGPMFTRVEKQVGPEGGVIEIQNDNGDVLFRVDVPAGALEEEILITIDPHVQDSTTPTTTKTGAGVELLSAIYEIGPSGTTFALPMHK